MSCRLVSDYYLDGVVNWFRGIPIGKNNTDEFIFGSLDFLNAHHCYISLDCDNKQEVNPLSVGEWVGGCIYEGDILTHPDYPDYLFEFEFFNGGWKPSVIYGTQGIPELRGFPKDLKEYGVIGWKFDYDWYSEGVSVYNLKRDTYIYLGTISYDNHQDFIRNPGIYFMSNRSTISFYFESDMGDWGRIGVYEKLLAKASSSHINTYRTLTLEDAIKEYPIVKELLNRRKLISF